MSELQCRVSMCLWLNRLQLLSVGLVATIQSRKPRPDCHRGCSLSRQNVVATATAKRFSSTKRIERWRRAKEPGFAGDVRPADIRSNRLVLLRLHGVVSLIHQNRAKPPAALSRSAEQLRINAQSAVMRNCSALRLRLAPDGGFAQLFLSACISQQVWASGEQYVWPKVSRRTGSSSWFADLTGEL